MNLTVSEHPPVSSASQTRDPLEDFRAPPGAGTLGTWMFVAGLAIAFTWLLYGYAVTRSHTPVAGLTVPVWFWFSTFALLVSSVTLHGSYLSAKMGQTIMARYALLLSTTLGWVFALLQAPGLVELIQAHRQSSQSAAAPYMLIFVLVALHSLHALGGLIRMTLLNRHPYHGSDPDITTAHLKQMCLFWHFLAIVWVVMFGVILWA